jgi:aerobic-type carbon monoxide dehydrogenase small subunit (CoxS/CutS family)
MISFILNRTAADIAAEDEKPLLWVLREDLDVLGSRYGCGVAQCGACRVLIDGVSTPSCVTFLGDIAGASVVTVDGLAGTDGELSVVQQAWIDEQVPQCGYCQPGFLVAVTDLLSRTSNPTDAEIDAAITNICRCGTYRRSLLRDKLRHLAVPDSVAALSGWGKPLAPGRGRGIAFEAAYESVGAEVAVADDGEVTVDRFFCSVDVGTVVNPEAVASQMEGGIVFGLTTALASAIDAGAEVESNFHDYAVLRMRNSPEVTVEIMPSDLPPGEAGEIGNVPVAAAVANAIHAATGRRLRSLPLAITEPTGERQTRSVLRKSAAAGT